MNTKEHYSSLDGIRAYAAIGIVLMHILANISVKPSENYCTQTLIPFFTDFTLLFMVVSAFSMCCGYYQRIKEGSISPNSFYKKRYLRILPFFAFLCLLDFLIEPSIETFYQVYANLTLCFGLLPTHNITVIGVGWFLGIVFLFYLLFPFFVFMLDTKKRAWGSFIVSLLFVIIAMNAEFVIGGVTRGNFVFCAPYFLAGGLIYLYRHEIVEFAKKYNILCAIVTILLTICYFAFKYLFSANLGYITELCLFALWILFAISTNTKLLSNRILKYLSNISMEIYLSHMIIYRVIEKVHLENYIRQNDILYIVTSILTICGVICFAHIMKYYVMNKIENKLL